MAIDLRDFAAAFRRFEAADSAWRAAGSEAEVARTYPAQRCAFLIMMAAPTASPGEAAAKLAALIRDSEGSQVEPHELAVLLRDLRALAARDARTAASFKGGPL